MKSCRKAVLLAFLVALVMVTGCAVSPRGQGGQGVTGTAEQYSLDEVRTWAYQLQGLSEAGVVEALAASPYDMLVLEPTCTDWSSDERDFDTGAMVDRLKASNAGDGIHRKLVLAYLDIGEAEDWRWYWTWSHSWDPEKPFPPDWPGFIISSDPDGWVGNYPVAYWEPAWKDIIIYGKNTASGSDGDYASALDEVLKHGFDGVYLDWVEGYEDSDVAARARAWGLDPAEEMVKFIEEIREYGRDRNPGFIVVQQNAAALAGERPEILSCVDGIAQEAIWYDGSAFDQWDDPAAADIPQDKELTVYYLEELEIYRESGLPVFDCEYATIYAPEAYANSRGQGFIPYCTRRTLSRLTPTPPF